MDFSIGMESPYNYDDEQPGGYYEECYSPNKGGSYYNLDCSGCSYDAQYCYSDEYSDTCAGMEDQPRSNWEELLEICIVKVFEHRKETNQRLNNLERNKDLLERGLENLVYTSRNVGIQYRDPNYSHREQHTLGMLSSLPEINLKGKCHAMQLRSGTTYKPLEAGDLGRGRK